MEISGTDTLSVEGARVHNLKDISVQIPREKLVVITGLSGSGKSSLAFDTIYAEGQRRYIESFAAYARQFLGTLERPDVDQITGLSPVIAIEQKTISRNPRSTVGTVTEIYDFLRLLFAKVSTAYSYNTGEAMVKYSDDQIVQLIYDRFEGHKINILSPIVKGRKGHYRELFRQLVKKGFSKVRVNGTIHDLLSLDKLDRYKTHDIELVVDRLTVNDESKNRIKQSVETAMKQGHGTIMVIEHEKDEPAFFSRNLMCPSTGIAYDDPAPNFFSFNSPYGACSHCNGLGRISKIDIKKIIPDQNKSILQGAIAPLGSYKNNWIYRQIEAIGKFYGFNLKTKFKDLSEEAVNHILYGSTEMITVQEEVAGVKQSRTLEFEGIVNFINRQAEENDSKSLQRWAQGFMNKVVCPECNGSRLRKEAGYFLIGKQNIFDVANMTVNNLQIWLEKAPGSLKSNQMTVAGEILKEINNRVGFLLEVGLDYLTLNRSSATLSGGEAQRIRLATQIGSKLVGVMYILDEPSIGLHQRDNHRLIASLQSLRDIGNSILVVEHDKDIMLESDHIIDIGPLAGKHGGEIVGEAAPKEFLKLNSSTAAFLSGKQTIPYKNERRTGSGELLTVKGLSGNNLQNIDISLPLGKFICVTGVSGSGKSTFVNKTLYPALARKLYNSLAIPMPYSKIEGLSHIDKVIEIDQAPIGRTPRSNPATYSGVFSDIRNLYASIPEAQIRGYKPGRFSFNVKGGRCEVCQGAGVKTIEMNFLPDVYVNCDSCNGKRYNRETLEVRYKGKSISDVLNMTIEEALEFFESYPKIKRKIQTLSDVGLGYIHLGQPSTTLSGGEAQRVKLASELAKKSTGKTLYILDEPTTGLHFEDIRILLEVLNKLVDAGNTLIVVEHNMDVIKCADHIIDLGPEGGEKGGNIVAQGTPEQIVKINKGYTAKFLKHELR